MKKLWKLIAFLLIASMLLAACGQNPAEAGIIPPQEVSIRVEGDVVYINIPEVSGMNAGQVVSSFGPWVLAVGGVAVADDATLVGIGNDPLAVALILAFVAQTACSMSPDCRAAEARVIATTIDGMVNEVQSLFANYTIVVTYASAVVLTETLILEMSVHQESERLNKQVLAAAAAGILSTGFGSDGCYFRLKASMKAVRQGFIYGIIGIECNNYLQVVVVGIPISLVSTAVFSGGPWLVNGTSYFYDPAGIVFRSSRIASTEMGLMEPDPSTYLTIEAGWAQTLNGRWVPYVDVLTVPLPSSWNRWIPGAHRFDGGVTP